MLNLILVSNGNVKAIESNNALCTYSVVKTDVVSKRKRSSFEKCVLPDNDEFDVVIYIGSDGIVHNVESEYQDDVYVVIYSVKEEHTKLGAITYAEFPKTQLNVLDDYFDSISLANKVCDVLCGVCDHEHLTIGEEDPIITQLLNIEADFLKASSGRIILSKDKQLDLLDSVIEHLVELCSDSVSLVEELKNKIQEEYNA